jgi:hypothetical protein
MRLRDCYLLAGLCAIASLSYSYFSQDWGILLLDIIFSYSLISIACELWEINKTLKKKL